MVKCKKATIIVFGESSQNGGDLWSEHWRVMWRNLFRVQSL